MPEKTKGAEGKSPTAKPEKREPASLKEKITDKLADHLATAVLGVIGLGANAGVWSGQFGTRFYHAGWWSDYAAWIPVFFILVILATVLTVDFRGFIAVSAATVLIGGAFAWLYMNPRYLAGNWPFIAWLLHGVGLALGTASLVGSFERLYRRWFGPVKAGM